MQSERVKKVKGEKVVVATEATFSLFHISPFSLSK